MTVTDNPQGIQVPRLTGNAVVTVMGKGMFLPRRTNADPHAVSFAELGVLQALARPSATPLGPSDPQVLAIIETLRDRGLVVDTDGTEASSDAGAGPSSVNDAPRPAASDPIAGDAQLVLVTPVSFRVTPDGFETADHDGRVLVRLSPAELDAAATFAEPRTMAEVLDLHRERAGEHALEPGSLAALVEALIRADVVHFFDEARPDHTLGRDRTARILRTAVQQEMRVQRTTRLRLEEHAVRAAEIDQQVGHVRVPVTPIHQNPMVPPLGLAMVIAYSKAIDEGRLERSYDFRPEWLAHETPIEVLTDRPGIFLVSNYIWSHRPNLELVAKIKAASPHSVMIHGGPDTPKYKGDVIDYFAINPFVDVAVHVEGEVTTEEVLSALVGCVGDGPPDLSPLRDVSGISFRDGDKIVQTSGRDRLEDLDVIPSPYLTGLFDNYGDAPVQSITIETNRGCPYGCTFCDWGSATMSRIRKFDLDRVFAELEWAAKRGIQGIGFADANFGIFERDVAIAEKVAELKATYGFPLHCGTNYAKNTVKHLHKIVETWVDAGIVTQGMLSLQTMDTETLTTIRRSNIKVEKYDSLAEEFRKAELPLFVDLMMGLPGQTVDSFRRDLQDTLEREVVAKIHPTTLLMNSPMNEPEYKALHRIEIANSGNLGLGSRVDQNVVATSSFTRDDYEVMKRMRLDHLLFENFGVLRHIARYVRQETGRLEVDLYETAARTARADPERWPAIEFTVESGPHVLAPPVSWRLFVDEVHRLLVDEMGVPDDDALQTCLTVQHALLPAPGRTFPQTYPLAHDYAAWHAAMLEAKARVGPQWTSEVPGLRSFGPAQFVVDDVHHVCAQGMGYPLEQGWLDTWDLDSPVARATLKREMTA
ncbi:MAG: radical SAM protein [Aquihabitans sp.]